MIFLLKKRKIKGPWFFWTTTPFKFSLFLPKYPFSRERFPYETPPANAFWLCNSNSANCCCVERKRWIGGRWANGELGSALVLCSLFFFNNANVSSKIYVSLMKNFCRSLVFNDLSNTEKLCLKGMLFLL